MIEGGYAFTRGVRIFARMDQVIDNKDQFSYGMTGMEFLF